MNVSGFLILLREFFFSPFLQKVLPGQHGHLLGNRLHKYIFFIQVSLAMMPRAADLGHQVKSSILQQQWSPLYIHTNTHGTVLEAHTVVFLEDAEFSWRRQPILKISGGYPVDCFLCFFTCFFFPCAACRQCKLVL